MESSAQDDLLSFGSTEYRRPNYSVTVFQPFAWTEMCRVENDAEWGMRSMKLKPNHSKQSPNIWHGLCLLKIAGESVDRFVNW
jgi:hypothetical protein